MWRCCRTPPKAVICRAERARSDRVAAKTMQKALANPNSRVRPGLQSSPRACNLEAWETSKTLPVVSFLLQFSCPQAQAPFFLFKLLFSSVRMRKSTGEPRASNIANTPKLCTCKKNLGTKAETRQRSPVRQGLHVLFHHIALLECLNGTPHHSAMIQVGPLPWRLKPGSANHDDVQKVVEAGCRGST